MAQSIPEMYGSLVFNDKVMRSKLPKDMYKALKQLKTELIWNWTLQIP